MGRPVEDLLKSRFGRDLLENGAEPQASRARTWSVRAVAGFELAMIERAPAKSAENSASVSESSLRLR
jgi:hypothetical protein